MDYIEDHGDGVFLVHYKDGSAYGVNLAVADNAKHQSLVEQIKSGAFKDLIRPASPRQLSDVVAFYCGLVDENATQRLKSGASAISDVQRLKLEEARDVIDVVESEGDAAISDLPDGDRVARYPMLSASGADIVATARMISAKALEQRQKLYAVEKWRLAAKAAIRAATTPELADAAYREVMTATQ